MGSNEDKSLNAETPETSDPGKLPGKLPNKKPNHIHIAADPVRLKSEEIMARQAKRLAQGKPSAITNEMIYEMLIDILENQKIIEEKLTKKPAASSPNLGQRF